MTMIHVDLLVTCTAFLLILYLYAKRWSNGVYSHLPYPPGPKKLPLIGNLLDMPKSFEWFTYHKWCKEFNTDILHVSVAGTNIIVLDTAEVAMDLLEKRSSIYSSRPRMPMITELMGWDTNVGLMYYGDRWRSHRKLLHQTFHPSAAMRFRPHELKATHTLLRNLLHGTSNVIPYLRHLAGETIMSITYGVDVRPQHDPYIELAERAADAVVTAAVPGAFLVDAIPALKYVPSWMPGARFKRQAKEWKKDAIAMVNVPFRAAKQSIATGNFSLSFVSEYLGKRKASGEKVHDEEVVRNTAGSMYTAGSDTTVAAIASFILGLLDKPDVLKKAQHEIDTVIGSSRLPNFDDQESLPYINAIVKETLRWRDVTPFGVPHCVEVDDEYRGYKIPAGSVIIANSWAMLHDEKVYPDPFTFNPDRFMKNGEINTEVRDPAHAAFGFGRRVCPGRYMATSAVWIAVASMIAVFDITKPLDQDGKVIEPSHEYFSGLTAMPKPYQAKFKPRSKLAEKLILSTASDL